MFEKEEKQHFIHNCEILNMHSMSFYLISFSLNDFSPHVQLHHDLIYLDTLNFYYKKI